MNPDLSVMRFEVSANASCRWAKSVCSNSHTDPALKELYRLTFRGFAPLGR